MDAYEQALKDLEERLDNAAANHSGSTAPQHWDYEIRDQIDELREARKNNTYWIVKITAFAFDDVDTAQNYAEVAIDTLCALKESKEIGFTTIVAEQHDE